MPIRKTGQEPFHQAGTSLPCSVLAFWQWAASDLVGNSLRGVFAEFLVAQALGLADGIRVWSPDPPRSADAYVFALHAHRDRATLDPLDLVQWEFYVLPTAALNERCAGQKRISLAALLRLEPIRALHLRLLRWQETCAELRT